MLATLLALALAQDPVHWVEVQGNPPTAVLVSQIDLTARTREFQTVTVIEGGDFRFSIFQGTVDCDARIKSGRMIRMFPRVGDEVVNVPIVGDYPFRLDDGSAEATVCNWTGAPKSGYAFASDFADAVESR